MRIFIRDSSIQVIDYAAWDNFPLQCMDLVLPSQKKMRKKAWQGNVLCRWEGRIAFQHVVDYLLSMEKGRRCHIVYVVSAAQDVQRTIGEIFPIIEAGGGVVRKGAALLFIKRKGYWDLPKGKVEAMETVRDAAGREVEEECNIRVRLVGEVCHTYHLMAPKGRSISLKRTHWYAMDCVDDSRMQPRVEESIDETVWVAGKDIKAVLKGAYPSIAHVIGFYRVLLARDSPHFGRL